MSWSGPIAGAAPYQTLPYVNGQPGYGQQPPYQYGQQPAYGQYQHVPSHPGPTRGQDSRPPKKKGNPVITRYPPPPGYRGPAQPQGLFHTHQHSAQYQPSPQLTYPSQGYNVATPQQGYTPASYGPSQASSYPPSYPQGQNYQWPQPTYQPKQNHPQSSAFPAVQNFGTSQTSYQPYSAHQPVVDTNQQAYKKALGWPQAQAQPTHPLQSQYNGYSGPASHDQPKIDPNSTPKPATAHVSPTQTTVSNPSTSALHNVAKDAKPELYLAWDDWDFDFDGAIWPKSNEPVDPNLSLGVVIWHPAKQVTRALPATFDEAEDQSLRPSPEKLGNGESVSIYFTAENSHEAFLDVRQTDDWDHVKDDPAFVVFTDEEMRTNLIPIEHCIAQRDRPDESVQCDANAEDAEMREADWSVMDNLEQALSASSEEPKLAALTRRSQSSQAQTQEDILASLGVTGLPKPVLAEPMPFPTQDVKLLLSQPQKPELPSQSAPVASGPFQMSMPMSVSSDSRLQVEPLRSQTLGNAPASNGPLLQRSYGSMSSANDVPHAPPPPPPEQDRYDPWNPSSRHQQYHTGGFNGGRGSPARSEASNGTAAGSDFGMEKPANINDLSFTPGSNLERNDSSASRKRSYGDTGADDDRVREHDDNTKRKRRSLVDAAYGRR